MKLYTEEQVKEMFEQFQSHLPFHYELLLQEHIMNKITPTKLPSDDEIVKNTIKPLHGLMDKWDQGFLSGAKWMRDKIQGDK